MYQLTLTPEGFALLYRFLVFHGINKPEITSVELAVIALCLQGLDKEAAYAALQEGPLNEKS